MVSRVHGWAGLRPAARAPVFMLLVLVSGKFFVPVQAAEGPAFFRGLNLNGPAVTIDGNAWEGSDSPHYSSKDKAFENQNVPLVPPTDPERAKMIRSSRWGGNRIELKDIPAGTYSVFLYLWEDNNSETFSISVNGLVVDPQYRSGSSGAWAKLGPWFTEARDGTIVIRSQGGAANFSGIELWRGKHDGSAPLTEEQTAFFEKRIRPLLVTHCYECHSAESKDLQGELLVDSRPTLLQGGTKGPSIVPGNLDKSLLIQAVRYTDENLEMPPDGKLSDEEIADLERWVLRTRDRRLRSLPANRSTSPRRGSSGRSGRWRTRRSPR
jgi:hypothetical protein